MTDHHDEHEHHDHPPTGRFVTNCIDAECPDLVCSGCIQALRVMPTPYGARATCGCPDIRWTSIRDRDPAVAPEWVNEKR